MRPRDSQAEKYLHRNTSGGTRCHPSQYTLPIWFGSNVVYIVYLGGWYLVDVICVCICLECCVSHVLGIASYPQSAAALHHLYHQHYTPKVAMRLIGNNALSWVDEWSTANQILKTSVVTYYCRKAGNMWRYIANTKFVIYMLWQINTIVGLFIYV